MKSAFVCPKCKEVFSDETEMPLNGASCPNCYLKMHYLGVSTEMWNKLTQEDKDALKEKVLDDYGRPQTMYLKRMSNDVHTIKNILIFYLILSICAGVVWAFWSCVN